jgi:hypothetical protein
VVREQHRPLRVALGRVEQGRECLTGLPSARLEARADVLCQRVGRQWAEAHRRRLREKRVPAIAEQGAHQTRV